MLSRRLFLSLPYVTGVYDNKSKPEKTTYAVLSSKEIGQDKNAVERERKDLKMKGIIHGHRYESVNNKTLTQY